MTAIAQLLLLAGSLLILVAAIGLVRFHDVLARMHALSKASNFGLLLVLAGGAIALDELNDVSFLVLAAVFQVLTTPVSTYLLGRVTYRGQGAAADAAVRRDDPSAGP